MILKEKVVSLVGVPTMTYELVNHPDFDKYDTSSLVGVGGVTSEVKDKNRTHHHKSQRCVRDEKVYKPHFSPECGGFSLEKVGEFRLNPFSPEQSSQTCPIWLCDGWSTEVEDV